MLTGVRAVALYGALGRPLPRLRISITAPRAMSRPARMSARLRTGRTWPGL